MQLSLCFPTLRFTLFISSYQNTWDLKIRLFVFSSDLCSEFTICLPAKSSNSSLIHVHIFITPRKLMILKGGVNSKILIEFTFFHILCGFKT